MLPLCRRRSHRVKPVIIRIKNRAAATIYYKSDNLSQARIYARAATTSVTKTFANSEECGAMHKLLGEIREFYANRGTTRFSKAIQSMNTAKSIFASTDTDSARRMLSETEEALKRLHVAALKAIAANLAPLPDDNDEELDPQTSNPPGPAAQAT